MAAYGTIIQNGGFLGFRSINPNFLVSQLTFGLNNIVQKEAGEKRLLLEVPV